MKIKLRFTEEELLKYPELKRQTNLFCLIYILKRMGRGKNALLLTYGETGSGKSWVNLRMAEILMFLQWKMFDTKNRVFNYVEQLAKYSDTKDLQPGDVSVSEELGVSMGARKWQRNIDYSELLQTFRDVKSICFFNVPFRIMADKHARYLAHFEIVMLPREGNKNVIKFFILQKNPSANTESKTVYRKYLRRKTTDYWGRTQTIPIKKMYWRKPSKKVLDVYLPMQIAFKSGIRKGIVTKAKKEEDNPLKLRSKERYEKTIELYKKKVHRSEIERVLGLSRRTIDRYIQIYNQKTQKRQNNVKKRGT